MRRGMTVITVAVFVAMALAGAAALTAQQAQPRQRGGDGRQAEPRSAPAPQAPRATPRPPAPSRPAPPPQRSRPAPPPRVIPPAYHAPPLRYAFPPVSLHRGFYYHPYFGFYFGPYYGPYYPYPGPWLGPARYAASALRTRVTPVETEVYVNGYFAGLVDDFDGVFQRLYLPAGQHELVFRLEGYDTWSERLYLQPGDTRDVRHVMRRLGPGQASESPGIPPAVPDAFQPGGNDAGAPPASPFGRLTLRIDPADAEVLVDGEHWLTMEGRHDLVIHVPAGPHRLDVRREGYRAFSTGIELSEGGSTRLDIQLSPLP